MAQFFIVYILLVQFCVMHLVTGHACYWTYTGKDNLQCYPCVPGFMKTDDCLFNYKPAQCSHCPEGTFMSDCNTENTCLLCNKHCYDIGMDIITNCTATTNSECRCKKGMYLTSDGYCQPHSSCSRGKGVKVSGNAFSDTICEDCVSGETYALNISAHEKCKPCTTCETYIQPCIPERNAKCQYTDSNTVVGANDGILWGILCTSLAIIVIIVIMSVTWCGLKWFWRNRRNMEYSLQCKKNDPGQGSRLLSPKVYVPREPSGHDSLNLLDHNETNSAALINAEQPTLTGVRYVPFPDNKPVHIVKPLIFSKASHFAENSAETGVIFSDLQDENALPEYQNTTEPTPLADCHENRQYINLDVKRQSEKFLLSPEKAANEGSEKGANTDINWCKIFKDIVPMLPVDERSWKFFAIELFDCCQESKGFPEDIHNEVKRIENKSSKDIFLSYHEVFQTWYRIMAGEASFDHIENSLERLRDNIIMKEFRRIKSNPPMKTRPKPCLSDSLVPYYGQQHEQFIPQQPCLLAYAQHESTYETENMYAQRQEKQFLQLTNFGGETRDHISQTFLQEPSRTLTDRLSRRSRKQHEHRMLTYRNTKVKKQVSREGFKLKKKIQATEKIKKLSRQHIKTIKKVLPMFQIRISRQEYNTFLDYTVNLMMEHNKVTRKVVLSITFKAYEEIAETKNGGRYLLYCGSPKLNLDRKQYDNLKFYVKHARARVLKELEELCENGDGIYLFLTYDGKSVLDGYQKKKSSVKERTYDSEYCGMDNISSSEDDSTTQSELSDIYDSSTDGPTSPLETVANSPATNSYELTHSPDKLPSLQEEVNDTCLENLNSGKHAFSSCVSTSDSNTEQLKGRNDGGVQNDDTEEISMQQASDNTQLGAKKEPVNSHVNSKMLKEESVPYIDMSLDDLMENIDKELECSEYV